MNMYNIIYPYFIYYLSILVKHTNETYNNIVLIYIQLTEIWYFPNIYCLYGISWNRRRKKYLNRWKKILIFSINYSFETNFVGLDFVLFIIAENLQFFQVGRSSCLIFFSSVFPINFQLDSSLAIG